MFRRAGDRINVCERHDRAVPRREAGHILWRNRSGHYRPVWMGTILSLRPLSASGDPEIVFVGLLGAEIVDKSLNPQERNLFRKNIVTYAEDLSRLAALLVLKQVDAVIDFSYSSRGILTKSTQCGSIPTRYSASASGKRRFFRTPGALPRLRNSLSILLRSKVMPFLKSIIISPP